MAIPILNLGLGFSLQRLSHDVTNSPISPKSGFADSELGKAVSNKIVLSKFSAVLKRKGNKTVNLKELDALQLELETLLLSSIKRKKILLKECTLLEKEHNADISIQHDTILQQIEPTVQLTSDSIKFAIPAPIRTRKLSRKKDSLDKALTQSIAEPQFRTPVSEKKRQKADTSLHFTIDTGEFNSELSTMAQPAELNETNTPAKKQKISRLTDSVAKPARPILVPQFTSFTSEKNNQKVDAGTDSTTNSVEFNSELSKKAQPGKLNETNTLSATSTSSQNLDQGNSHSTSSSVEEKKSNASTKMQNLELPKNILDKKTARAIRIAQTRNANALNRSLAPARKYWHSLRSMCRYISDTEIKAFEEVIKDQESMNKVSKDVLVEGFFASEWAESELNEEKIIASTNVIPRKATEGASEDVLNMMRRAKKLVDKERTSECLEAEPLYSQLLKSLRDEKLLSETKNKRVKVLPSAIAEETLSNNSDIEEAMRADLVRAGILTKEQIVRADSVIEKTEIDVEIQQLRGTLRALIKYNKAHLNHVLKLGKLEVRKHTLIKQLMNKGRDIEKAYMSILAYKKKNEPVKNPIKKALKLVQERKLILRELNDLTLV